MVDASLIESLHDQDWIRLEKSFLSDDGDKTDFSVVLTGLRLPIIKPSMAYLLVVLLSVVVVLLMVVRRVVVVAVVIDVIGDVVELVLFSKTDRFALETKGLCGFSKSGPNISWNGSGSDTVTLLLPIITEGDSSS